MSPAAGATLLPELALAAETGARRIAGVDEVGRGALAGPVSVGVVVLDLAELSDEVSGATGVWPPLEGVRDSKLLSAAARQRWRPTICAHAAGFSVQHSAANEIDSGGISAAMGAAGRAGLRAVEQALTAGGGPGIDLVLLDGVHDWLQVDLPVRTMAKADTVALSVACASVLAKVERDGLMVDYAREHPDFGWESNKGYGSAAHRRAIRETGPSRYHRRSWNLGLEPLPGL